MKGICFLCTAPRCLKGKPKNAKERTMQTEQAELHFRQGSSDKVYHLQLENVEDQWSVQAQWGRRGSALQSDVNFHDPGDASGQPALFH
jgi:hypothetical protein